MFGKSTVILDMLAEPQLHEGGFFSDTHLSLHRSFDRVCHIEVVSASTRAFRRGLGHRVEAEAARGLAWQPEGSWRFSVHSNMPLALQVCGAGGRVINRLDFLAAPLNRESSSPLLHTMTRSCLRLLCRVVTRSIPQTFQTKFVSRDLCYYSPYYLVHVA